jgi:hypothetical protein
MENEEPASAGIVWNGGISPQVAKRLMGWLLIKLNAKYNIIQYKHILVIRLNVAVLDIESIAARNSL